MLSRTWVLAAFALVQDVAATIATRQECTGGFSNKWALEHTNDNTTEVPGIMCFAGHGNPDDPYTTVGQDQCVAFCNSCAARLNTVVGAFNYVPTGGCRCYSEEQAREMRIAPDNTWQYCRDYKWVLNSNRQNMMQCGGNSGGCYTDSNLEACRHRCELANDCTMYEWYPPARKCCIEFCAPPGASTGFPAPGIATTCSSFQPRDTCVNIPRSLRGHWASYVSMGVISGKDYRPDISTRQPSWAKTNNNGECYGGNRPFMGNNGDQGQEHGGPDTYHSCVVDRGNAQWWTVQLRYQATNPRVRFITRNCCVGNMANRVEFYIGQCRSSSAGGDIRTYARECKALPLADGEKYSFICEGKGECVYVFERAVEAGRRFALDFAELTVYAHPELDTAMGLIEDTRSELGSEIADTQSILATVNNTATACTALIEDTRSELADTQSTLMVAQAELSAATSTLMALADDATSRRAALGQITATVAARLGAVRATAAGSASEGSLVATPKIGTNDGNLVLVAPAGKVVLINGNAVADQPAVAGEVSQTLELLEQLIAALD